MKQLVFTILLFSFFKGECQIKDTSYFDGCNWVTCSGGGCLSTVRSCVGFSLKDGTLIPDSILFTQQDSLTAERFINDSLGNSYMVEYSYVTGLEYWESKSTGITSDTTNHHHYIANCSIIKYKGNRQQTIFKNIKAIYSPVECSADSRELWLKRLYQLQNKK